jgi:hypothetical protein
VGLLLAGALIALLVVGRVRGLAGPTLLETLPPSRSIGILVALAGFGVFAWAWWRAR